jgi:hypothetical protein
MSSTRMSIEDILQSAPEYMNVVSAYDLDVAGGDWQVDDSGDIAVTLDGDLKFGNDRINATHRLIQRWCFNVPILSVLFSLAAHSKETIQRLDAERDVIAPLAFQNRQSMERFNDINNEIVAHTFGGGACAGAIIIILNNLLMRYRDDLKPAADKWETGSPQIEGRSFGSIVTAAAANFRHHDEWARTHPPTNQQLGSIKIIADVLKQPIAPDGNRHPFRHNVCPDLLDALSGGDFERLSHRFFTFAKDVAA